MEKTNENNKTTKHEEAKKIKELIIKIKQNISNKTREINGITKKISFRRRHADDFYEVYREFGKEAYLKYVPQSIRKQSIKNALVEGRYMDIYDIHGEKAFNSKISKMLKGDISIEAESKKQRIKGWIKYIFPYKLKKSILPISMGLALAPAALLVPAAESAKRDDSQSHQVEITEYLDDVREYGNQVRQYNLTPIQMMMKVTDDMWSRIEGYGDPKLDILGYAGIDVSKEMGVGVCRNMADDCARRLNAIDESFNARVIPVYFENGDYQRANIDSKLAKSDEESKDTKDDAIFGDFVDDKIMKGIGNHAVVLLNIKEDDVTLVLDPTNAGIGLYYNDKIAMFNSYGSAHPVVMKTTAYGYCMYGLDKAVVERPNDMLSSLGIYTKSRIAELNNKFGIDAQNKALDDIRKIGKSKYAESLRVDEDYDIVVDQSEHKNTYTISMKDMTEKDSNMEETVGKSSDNTSKIQVDDSVDR